MGRDRFDAIAAMAWVIAVSNAPNRQNPNGRMRCKKTRMSRNRMRGSTNTILKLMLVIRWCAMPFTRTMKSRGKILGNVKLQQIEPRWMKP